MKPYLLTTESATGVNAAVFATGAQNPLEALAELENELNQKKVVGAVLFDVLLSQGSKTNRYYIGEFDGKHFKKSKIRSATDKYTAYASFSARFLREHSSEIDLELLSAQMRSAVRAGMPL